MNFTVTIYKRERVQVYKDLGIGTHLTGNYSATPKRLLIGWRKPGRQEIMADVVVVNRDEAVEYSHRNSVKAHRVHVFCPDCNELVPLGRIQQHIGSAKCAARAGHVTQEEAAA